MNLAKLAVAILVWSCLLPGQTLACRYNVRDVGFVDLGGEPYVFYAYLRQDTPKELLTQLKEISSALLADSNIDSDIINIDQQKDHIGLKYLPAEAAFPAGVLVSPDGQSLPLAFGKSQQTFRESLVAALDEIVSSPKRDEIVQRVTRDYAAILLIEGPNADENGRARKAIAEAIKQIGGQLSALPKVIAHAPSLLVLDPASFARERVLLWSLGLSPEKITQTRAAVIYGKARWIGPLMKDEEINEGNLSRLLSIIGADCECGLDISWTQGTRLPVRWDEKLHAQLAKALSFDPENPLVKIEVGRIVGRRNESTTARERNQEQTLNVSTSDGFRESSAASDTNKVPPPREQGRGPTPPLPTVAETAPLLHSSLLITAGLAFVALSAGAWIFLREARRRRRE